MHYERTPRFTRLKLRVVSAAPDSRWLTSASKKLKGAVLNDGTFTLGESKRWHEELPPKEATQ